MLAVLGQAEHRAHVQPVLARQAVDSHPSVGGADDTQHGGRPQVGGQAEVLHPARHQHRIGQRGQQRLQLGDVDLPDPAGGRQPQRGQHAQRAVDARDVLGDAGADLYRWAVGIPGADPTRCRLHGQRRGPPLAPGPALTERRDAQQHQVWGQPGQGVRAQPPAFQRSRHEILDEHMRPRDELAGGRQVVRPGQIEGGAALAGVEVVEQAGTLGVGYSPGKRAPSAQRIPGGRLDLGDLGAEVDEKLCGVRT